MSLARTIRRGDFLKARLGVKGIQKDSRSLGTLGARGRVLASDIFEIPSHERSVAPPYSSPRPGTEIAPTRPFHAPQSWFPRCSQGRARRLTAHGNLVKGQGSPRGAMADAKADGMAGFCRAMPA